jgi:hypothetical protein
MSTYGQGFYKMQIGGSARSAPVVVPVGIGILPARSVRKVGCGAGIWPGSAVRCGTSGLPGLARDDVDLEALRIPAGQFRAV